MIDDRWGICPFLNWCPYKTAVCKSMLPDNTCPVYTYFKRLILKEIKNEQI